MALTPALIKENNETTCFFFIIIIFLSLTTIIPNQIYAQTQNTSKVYMSTDRPRALVLMGDRYHSATHIRNGLMVPLALENIPVVYIENHEALTADALKDFNLLILFKDGNTWPNGYESGTQKKWMTDEQQQAISDFVNNGGSFLALHNSHGLYPKGGPFYEIFDGDYGGHPEPEEFMIRIENKEHPITAGVEDFRVYDEQHMSKYYGDSEQLIMRNVSDANKSAPAGWWREVGKGKFCYLSPGHTPEALKHPMVELLIRNSIRWLTQEKFSK